MNKKILIIGGSGILSSAVVDCCLSNGNEVTMINRGNNLAYTNQNAKIIICDARDINQVEKYIHNLHFDVVIDFIVYTKEQLLASLSLYGKKTNQYIFISSAQVYNTSIKKELNESSEKPQVLWNYSINKEACENFLRIYCNENCINYTIVRPGVNYDNRRIPYGMCPQIGKHWTMISRIQAGKPIITWNNGTNKLNLTRVEDFAVGLVGLLGNTKAYNESFNIVGDFIYSWKEVLDELGKLTNSTITTVDLPLNSYAKELCKSDQEMLIGGRACDLICSNLKLKSIVPSFSPSINLTKGLKMTLNWYLENSFYLGFDYSWDAEQDRIIEKIYPKKFNVGYVSYSPTNFIDNLINLCEYNVSYYKNAKILHLFWKYMLKILKMIY